MSFDPEKITYFAETDARNKRVKFGIKAKDRQRHIYVIGKTGMGKSTILENMAIQDIQNGEGLAFVDPHGKSADLLLDYVPQERIKDVIYFAPFDTDYPISFNIMEDVGADKRHLVVNGLMATFEKIWVDAWSARMAYILQNTLLALLEYPGSTLLGVNRMLVDKDYRNLVVNNVTDPSVKSFWQDEFAKYTDRYTQEATPAIQNKVGQFTANPLIRNIVGQPKSTFDLREMMDKRKIVIVNLSKGKVGEGNAKLLGSMFITKIYLAAMSRADVTETTLQQLPNFYLYVDEFQSFANKSFADILSEARKYKLNLTLAHQYIEQMEEEVRAAVFGNVGTMVSFRVGAYDAEVLEKEFAPTFTAEDMVNLGIFQTYLKLMIDGVSSQPFSAVTMPPIPKPDISFRQDIIENSRQIFAGPRVAVEEEIRKWHERQSAPPRVGKEIEGKKREGQGERWGEQKRDGIGRQPDVDKKAIFKAIISEEKDSPIQIKSQFDPSQLGNRIDGASRASGAGGTYQEKISLEKLKSPEEKKKPTPEHVSQLRAALAELTQKQKVSQQPTPVKQVPSLTGQATNDQQQVHLEKERTVSQHPIKKIEPQEKPANPQKISSEVTEDELKKLLQVDI